MTSPAPPPLTSMLTGYWISQSAYVAAKLGIADLLQAGPRTVEQLAATTDTNADALYRLLRALASVGLFAEDEPNCFAATSRTRSARWPS